MNSAMMLILANDVSVRNMLDKANNTSNVICAHILKSPYKPQAVSTRQAQYESR